MKRVIVVPAWVPSPLPLLLLVSLSPAPLSPSGEEERELCPPVWANTGLEGASDVLGFFFPPFQLVV